jgi:hypothetical protein
MDSSYDGGSRVKADEAMSEEEFSAAIKAAADDAIFYIDDQIAPEREQATSYYRGDPMGTEEEGRSQVVMTEVRDVVQAILPSLLRVFCGTERVVEFAPRLQAKIEEADQATDYVNYIFHVENPGFTILFSAFKDALVRKTGIVKWYVDESVKITEQSFSGMSDEDIAALQTDDDIEIIEQKPDEDTEEPEIDPATGAPLGPVPNYTVRIRRTLKEQRFKIEVVPPEEFLIARDARDLDHADYIGHRREVPLSDLVAMGYDRDELEENATSGGFEMNNEREERNPSLVRGWPNTPSNDPMMRKVLYIEHYIRIDKDGDGIAETRRVCTVGDGCYVLHDEVWDDMVPFAVFCPDPEPHMVIGYSMADQTKDLQEIKTAIVRNTLDSLAQTIFPRTVVLEGAVNMDDVLSTEIGQIIRARTAGAVQSFAEPFVGQQALGVLAYLDDVRAQRTGISKATQGLDADVLQSTTKAAVTAITSAAEQRIEMIARIFAEGPMRRIFRGLLRMVIRHQDKDRIARLRGKFVPIDPKYWDADMDVIVNVGLGLGNNQDRAAAMMAVFNAQKEIIAQFGPLNPLSGIMEAKNTLVEILKIGSVKDTSKHVRDVTPDELQQYQQQQQQNKQDDPQMMLAKAEMAKSQADIVISKQKSDLEFVKAKMQDDRERDRLEVDMQLRAAELQMKYGAQVNIAAIKAEVDRARDSMEAQIKQAGALTAQPTPSDQMQVQ